MPKHNADYWIPKLQRNVERDKEKTMQLEMEGWFVITVWECEIRKNLDNTVRRVIEVLEILDDRDSML